MQKPLHCSILTISGTSLSFAYDASGLRTSKTVSGTTYRYYYASGKLMRLTWGSNTVDFFYDANGTPYAMKYNGTLYYNVTNLQGDVMRVVNASGTVVASYDYDPYGKVISATGTLANITPLRYRGYVYDQETGFYYLQSRYYDPEICRFINADNLASTGQGIVGHNMFAYCGNNPVARLDDTGDLWLAILSALAVQYTSDVLTNIARGETGSDIFIPTLSLATYTAAAVTVLIPGGTVMSAVIRSTVTESILWVDNVLNGESQKNDVKQSLKSIVFNTVLDVTTGKLMESTFETMGSQDFASYLSGKKHFVTNLQDAYKAMHRSNKIGRAIGKTMGKFFEIMISYATR